jgi:hypothetical protein
MINSELQIKWTLWSTSAQGRAEKFDYNGSVIECVKTLEKKIEQFLFHVLQKREQSSFFETIKTNVTDKQCLVQVGYAENYSIIEQHEIQTAHWSRRQLSLFTIYIWSDSISQPMVVVSNDISHNKFTVSQCLEHVLKRLKLLIPLLEQVIIFSDGSASQFKQRFLSRISHF